VPVAVVLLDRPTDTDRLPVLVEVSDLGGRELAGLFEQLQQGGDASIDVKSR
jgi:hypothetical protein